MMLSKIFARQKSNDLFSTCSYLLRDLKIKFTDTKLSEALNDHVEYPSLLSIKDSLFNYGIESAAIRKGAYSYDQFDTPFVSSIQKEGWQKAHFTIVTKATAEGMEYLDPVTDKLESISIEEFDKIDKGILLLLDVSTPKHEENFFENKKKERNGRFDRYIPIYLGISAILVSISYILFWRVGEHLLHGVGFILSAFLGLAISSLLIWNEIDAHNPFIKEVCGSKGKKTNCNAVLSSSMSSFIGISWSTWGFAFFATFFLSQVSSPANPGFMLIWSVLSLLAAPYILFSIFYQWRIIKQWCPLCLAVQFVLAVNALISISYLLSIRTFFDNTIFYNSALTLLIGMAFLFMTTVAIPKLKNAHDGKNYKKRWKKLKYSPQMFQSLLEKSDRIDVSPDSLGIVMGNSTARNEIIKVCNPYCGPCAKAHPELEHILKTNPEVRVRIIFTASVSDDDVKMPPVAHLLAIQQEFGAEKVHRALNDWYMAPNKNYEAFAEKYPLKGELKEQTEKIQAMRNWCNEMKIRSTPTIYVNGRELPDSYSVAELKNFF